MRLILTVEVADGGRRPIEAHEVLRQAIDYLALQVATDGFTNLTVNGVQLAMHVRLETTGGPLRI